MIDNLIRLLSSKICQTSAGVCAVLCSSLIIYLYFVYPNLAAGRLKGQERLTRRIVPEPKTAISTDNRSLTLLPSDITIVYGQSSPKTKIGAEEINKELYRLGLAKRMRIVSDEQYEAGNEKLLVLTGGVGENTATKAIWEKVKHREELNAMNQQGYIIDYVEDWRPPAVVLAGASPQGSLYACITFMQMLDTAKDNVVVHPLFVKDWPDFRWRYLSHPAHYLLWTGNAPESAYPEGPLPDMSARGKEYVDWMLRYKINVLRIMLWWGWEEDQEAVAHWRSFLSYAKERGILSYMSYSVPTQAVGYVKTHQEFEKIKDRPEYEGLTNVSPSFRKSKHFITWSRDDLLEPKFRAHARKCRNLGVGITWFHSVDTGLGSFNYAKWKDRDELDRKRWDNDYGRADSHVISLAYKIMKEESPETRIVFVVYPYSAGVLSDDFPHDMLRRRGKTISRADGEKERQFIRRYFRTLSEETPEDIFFCLRENPLELTQRWMAATRRPIMLYYDTYVPFCSSRARYIKTWYSKEYENIYFWPSISSRNYIFGLEMPMRVLLHAEYCWNTEQEGAGLFQSTHFYRDFFEPEVVFEKIIPRACRAYWGDEGGPHFVPLFHGGIAPDFIEDPDKFFQEKLKKTSGDLVKMLEREGNTAYTRGEERFANPSAEMRRQLEHLEFALPSLEKWLKTYELKERDPYTYRYGTLLYLLAHYWYRKAAVWVPYLELKQAIHREEDGQVRALVLEGQAAIRTGKAEIEKVLGRTSTHPCLMPIIGGQRLDKKLVAEFDVLASRFQEL